MDKLKGMITRLKVYVIFIILVIWMIPSACNAGGWEFNIFGINPDDFKDRNPIVIVIGAAVSFAVHEAGHYAVAQFIGDGVHHDWSGGFPGVVMIHGYHDMTHGEQQLFHGAGFLAQGIVGTALTLIPYTRHSDIALGFNTFTMVNSIGYSFKNDVTKYRSSDVARLDHGEAAAIATAIIGGVNAYINLDKVD